MPKVKTQITKEFDVASIRVSAQVRYWEDATVNGVEDTDGSLIPLREGDMWQPTINLATGRVYDWPDGTTASIHYKVCDAGAYELLNADGLMVAAKSGYVPDVLGVGEPSYGDYIIMEIGPDGVINGWDAPDIDPDLWTWGDA